MTYIVVVIILFVCIRNGWRQMNMSLFGTARYREADSRDSSFAHVRSGL